MENTKTIAVGEVRIGEKFKVAGHEYVVLNKTESSVFVIESMSFGDMYFGKTNDWRESDIRAYLRNEYMEKLINNDLNLKDILSFAIDLKETNGGREYGYDSCKVGLLTLEQYTKYAEYIPLNDESWWLATPNKTPNSRSPSTNSTSRVWCVYNGGNMGVSDAYNSYGIRPVLLFSSSLFVSVDRDENEDANDYETGYKAGYETGYKVGYAAAIKKMTDLIGHDLAESEGEQ